MEARPILVTGGSGQLARALHEAAASRALRVTGRPEFDFDRPERLTPLLRQAAPALIINTAAYTAVDKAETDADAAFRANRDGPAVLAAYCAETATPLLHISTDYVFDGLKGEPYAETDRTGPTGVYGASKLAGEQAVLASGAPVAVLRTSWVYAPEGRNFVLTMLALARQRERLGVVVDQKGCPTAAGDLAAALLAIADRIIGSGWQPGYGGIFHAAGAGETTWHGFATAIFAAAGRHGRKPPSIDPITTADYPTPARRPPDSRLACDRLAALFGLRLPDWRDALDRTIDRIFAARPATPS